MVMFVNNGNRPVISNNCNVMVTTYQCANFLKICKGHEISGCLNI